MPIFRSTPFRGFAVLLAVALALVVAVVAFVPLAASLTDTTDEGATISFSISDQLLLRPSDCATIAWDSANIESIFVNGKGTIGTSETAYCPAESNAVQPYMLVNMPDDTFYTYELPTLILSRYPPFYAALALGVLVLLVAFVPLPSVPEGADAGRRRLLGGVGAALVLGVLGAVGITVYRRETEPDVVICKGWVVRADELRSFDCEGN